MIREQAGYCDETDGGLRVQNVERDACRASFSQIPIMLLGEDTVKPRIRTPSFSSKCTFRFGSSLARKDTRSHLGCLVVKEGQGKEEGMDDITIKAEGLLFARRA